MRTDTFAMARPARGAPPDRSLAPSAVPFRLGDNGVGEDRARRLDILANRNLDEAVADAPQSGAHTRPGALGLRGSRSADHDSGFPSTCRSCPGYRGGPGSLVGCRSCPGYRGGPGSLVGCRSCPGYRGGPGSLVGCRSCPGYRGGPGSLVGCRSCPGYRGGPGSLVGCRSCPGYRVARVPSSRAIGQSRYFGSGGLAGPSTVSHLLYNAIQVPSRRMRSRLALTARTRSSRDLVTPMP